MTEETEAARTAHLDWCKKRALEYWDRGDLANAVTSMASDLEKHPDCKVVLMDYAMFCLIKHDAAGVHRWITGFR